VYGPVQIERRPLLVLVVFAVKGNDYRLITEINYQSGRIFLGHILTHAEYDRGGWKKCSASVLSEIFNDKRKLTTGHIKKLSRRFHVPPGLFL
jgi:hypothetical protein